MMRRPLYYRLVGRQPEPMDDLIAWGKWFETADRRVARTEIGPLAVSTVFLGIDHNHVGVGAPILFESMIFGDSEGAGEGRRYRSWDAAERGHAELVALCRARLAAAERLLGE